MAKVTGVSNYLELVGNYTIYDNADNLLYKGDNMMSNNYIYQDVDVTNIIKQFIDKTDKVLVDYAKYLSENGVPTERVIWPTEVNDPELAGKYKAAMDMLANKEIDLVINIPKNFSHGELTNGYHVRRAAIDFNIPLITNARLATAFIRAFCAMSIDDIQIKSWDQY